MRIVSGERADIWRREGNRPMLGIGHDGRFSRCLIQISSLLSHCMRHKKLLPRGKDGKMHGLRH
jgi:hypothetical protein